MENPATWGPLERAIKKAIGQARENREAGLVGLSEVRIIADAVRAVQNEQARQAGNALHFAATEVERLRENL